MTAVPRPVTKLTDEQRRLLDEAVKAAAESRKATETAWERIITARAAGVPDELLCDETGFSRATLNRRYGRRRQSDSGS
ncbi:hypothetical protein [Actinoplanes sp. NPDC049599]|uniref:hypothetical protein n=1 Tax=Actinoplanes sp. NPDC049599 TaxID=3363903 RepID=UPI0037B6858B